MHIAMSLPLVRGFLLLSCSLLLAGGIAALAPLPAAAAIVADDAADLCAPAADPCIVSQEVAVASGSRLDFGLRTLRVQGTGLLDFGSGSAELLCGRFEAATSGSALRMRGSTVSGTSGGSVALLARRRCSVAAGRACFTDADCAPDGGSCSDGDGSVALDGGVSGNAALPGSLSIKATADIAISKSISLSGSTASADGGTIELESTAGSLRISASLDATGGTAASGGSISLLAGTDIVVDAPLSATGGDYDGGSVSLQADRDVLVHADVRVDALGGAGFGGEIDAGAGRDLDVSGGSSSNNLLLSADGHQSSENYGGDGGTIALDAGRNLTVSRYVRISSNGAPPDGFADTISLSAGGDIGVDASLDARGRGSYGGGGIVEIDGDGDVRLGESVAIDLGGSAAGGDFDLLCAGNLDVAADIDATAASAGVGGRIFATAGGDALVSGSWKTAGDHARLSVGELVLEGCHVRVAGPWVNSAAGGANRITARESITIHDTASLLASGDGATNTLGYRSSEKPPRLDGSVSPPPILALDAALPACAVCGDGEVDQGESCDDGDVCTTGDACRDGLCPTQFPSLDAASVRIRYGRDGGADHVLVKASFASSWLAVAPDLSSVRVLLSDEDSAPLVDETLPAGSLGGDGDRWRFVREDTTAAGGIVAASIRMLRSGGGKARVSVVRTDAGAAESLQNLRLALILGDDRASGSCASSALLECVRGRGKLRCTSSRSSQ